jgi:lipoprotein-anchoring transpeptidase ErfK/SrfK
VLVRPAELVVRLGPSTGTRRRGVAVKGSRLPVFESSAGPGCASSWYRVFERGWVCGDQAEPSEDEPAAERLPSMKPGGLTPWPYAFVRSETVEYRASGGDLQEVREVEAGFGFGVAGYADIDGRRFVRTVDGRLVPAAAAGVTGRVSEYEGVALQDGKPWPVGWVNSQRAHAYREPSRRKEHRLGPVERYDMFQVLEERGQGKGRFYRFDEGAWLWSGDVRVARPATRPDGVAPGERWIDVDLAQQIVTAYEGDVPRYATMASTGRGGKSRTVKGEFPIWAKIAAIAMDNTDEEEEVEETSPDSPSPDAGVEEERHLYSLHDVPWTQFFHESFGLHGVYWHNRFGNRKSHGCVNLSPRDARWFYDWTRPGVPDGWWAIHTVPEDRPTVVRVR